VSFCSRSFLALKLSQNFSQLIHRRLAPAFASGLEIKNPPRTRQEKNEFYFLGGKKFA
jgi:hypothetical protein